MKNTRALMAAVAFAGVVTGLGGCAVEPVPPPRTDVFVDAAFKPPGVRIDPQEALKLSPAMQRFAESEMERWLNEAGLTKVRAAALPPARGEGLTVKIWTAERVRQAERTAA